MGPNNTKLIEDIIALVGERKDLDVEESEVRFIATILAGYISSPPLVRFTLVPKLKGVVADAIKMIQDAKGSSAGGLSN